MEKIRGFEIAKGYEDKGINLPERKTKEICKYETENMGQQVLKNKNLKIFSFTPILQVML